MIHRYEVKRIQQPLVGLLQLNFVWAAVEQDSGLRMSVMTPSDVITAQRLITLAERTADLPATVTRAS